ncbi:hypothetical protein GCM10009760_17750 [Kitasatospora kazusensis]|uniref:Helix-turn-helix protein n=1 Tax=Kitasatospora kazusensis TaxID=407974 RepID=A0ABP5L0T0_9ACTN
MNWIVRRYEGGETMVALAAVLGRSFGSVAAATGCESGGAGRWGSGDAGPGQVPSRAVGSPQCASPRL